MGIDPGVSRLGGNSHPLHHRSVTCLAWMLYLRGDRFEIAWCIYSCVDPVLFCWYFASFPYYLGRPVAFMLTADIIDLERVCGIKWRNLCMIHSCLCGIVNSSIELRKWIENSHLIVWIEAESVLVRLIKGMDRCFPTTCGKIEIFWGFLFSLHYQLHIIIIILYVVEQTCIPYFNTYNA